MTDAERKAKIEMLTEENRISLMAFLEHLIDLQDKHQNEYDSQE